MISGWNTLVPVSSVKDVIDGIKTALSTDPKERWPSEHFGRGQTAKIIVDDLFSAF